MKEVAEINTFSVKLKTKPEFIFTYIPVIKVKAHDKTEAAYKALDYADKKLNFRRIAIEVLRVEEI